MKQVKKPDLRKLAERLPKREAIREYVDDKITAVEVEILSNKKTVIGLGVVFIVGLLVGAALSRGKDDE